MKRFAFPFLFLLLTTGVARGQDLRHLYLVANYGLVNSPRDAMGFQAPAELIGIEYAGRGGAISTGESFDGAPTTSVIRTPPLQALTDTAFAIQLEFKIDTLDGRDRPILVAGYDWHFLGFYLTGDNRFRAAINDTRFQTVRDITASDRDFYELTILYTHNPPSAPWVRFYLGTDLVAEFLGEALHIEPRDGDITNVHTGIGETFLGRWRNLRIYAAHPAYGYRDPAKDVYTVKAFPNPAVDRMTVEVSRPGATRWALAGPDGSIVRQGIAPDVRFEINVVNLPPGKYILILRDQEGYPVAQHAISKSNQGVR